MGSFISRIIDIGFMPNAPWLYWLVFDTVGLLFLKMLIEDVISSLYYLKFKTRGNIQSILYILFDLVIIFLIAFLFYRLYFSATGVEGILPLTVNFSLFLVVAVCFYAIVGTIRHLVKPQNNVIEAKPKFFRMSRSKRRKENLKNNG
ncbi:hypothetical protein [Campylobacter concisus]|jgi:hypothetical protein|uniref:hypothetical protein n=1 Tax=Campylobacter concisus TaxID=199 RepID=UPI000CD981DE|nr:hypothetical protein [Campylobacter concisus]